MKTDSLQRILYVEDERDIQTIVRLSLETAGGFTLEVCSTGQEALDKAQAFMPDLILLDVMMPGMDGPTTLAGLRNLDGMSETPVIFMTAKAQEKEISQFRALGALDIIAKPFDPLQLADAVRSIWESHHACH